MAPGVQETPPLLVVHSRTGPVPPAPGCDGMPFATVSSSPCPSAVSQGPSRSPDVSGRVPRADHVAPPEAVVHNRQAGLPLTA